ncbi:MAG: histidine phosphatase family protein [Planctomycetia bacterium]|nr:histidine phosphatase family protein [Planctomycetia bacterium]
MKLYIVRHAWAEEPDSDLWPDDGLRPLTQEGKDRFRKEIGQLGGMGFAPEIIATSPLVRCRETAEIIAGCLPSHPDVVECEELEPKSQLAGMVSWTRDQKREQVAWVGHAPDVEIMTARLIGDDNGRIHFAKGAVAAVYFDKRIRVGEGELRWLVTAKTLGFDRAGK